jgi:hypothetical protein
VEDERSRSDGGHPNSLGASTDPEIRKKIRAGRMKDARDRAFIEAWFRLGFSAGSPFDEEMTI